MKRIVRLNDFIPLLLMLLYKLHIPLLLTITMSVGFFVLICALTVKQLNDVSARKLLCTIAAFQLLYKVFLSVIVLVYFASNTCTTL